MAVDFEKYWGYGGAKDFSGKERQVLIISRISERELEIYWVKRG